MRVNVETWRAGGFELEALPVDEFARLVSDIVEGEDFTDFLKLLAIAERFEDCGGLLAEVSRVMVYRLESAGVSRLDINDKTHKGGV